MEFWKINNFVSPTIMERLKIDTNYNGAVFNVCISDVPAKKKDLVKGEYKLELSKGSKVQVKIVDMLGEEVVVSF